jgi:hypothetical protein
MMICALLFIIGFVEEFIAVIYYGCVRKGWKGPCAIVSMIRNIVWLLVTIGIFSSFLEVTPIKEQVIIFLFRAISHTIGVGVGDYCSLLIEPYFDKVILKLSRKGKRKVRFYIKGERKNEL